MAAPVVKVTTGLLFTVFVLVVIEQVELVCYLL